MVNDSGNNLLSCITYPVNGDDNALHRSSNDYHYRPEPAYPNVHGNELVNYGGHCVRTKFSELGNSDDNGLYSRLTIFYNDGSSQMIIR